MSTRPFDIPRSFFIPPSRTAQFLMFVLGVILGVLISIAQLA